MLRHFLLQVIVGFPQIHRTFKKKSLAHRLLLPTLGFSGRGSLLPWENRGPGGWGVAAGESRQRRQQSHHRQVHDHGLAALGAAPGGGPGPGEDPGGRRGCVEEPRQEGDLLRWWAQDRFLPDERVFWKAVFCFCFPLALWKHKAFFPASLFQWHENHIMQHRTIGNLQCSPKSGSDHFNKKAKKWNFERRTSPLSSICQFLGETFTLKNYMSFFAMSRNLTNVPSPILIFFPFLSRTQCLKTHLPLEILEFFICPLLETHTHFFYVMQSLIALILFWD